MNILVAGGAGYIGSIVSALLVEHGHRVIVLDDLSKGHGAAVPESAVLAVGDLGDGELVRSLCDQYKIDAAMHFAAFAEVAESVAHPERYFDNNFVRTKRLVDALVAANVKKFVFSSSAAVYGEPAQIPILETHPRQPTNPYGWTKLFVEEMLRAYAQPHGLRSVSFRYFNAAGATRERGEDHDPESHLIPVVLQAALGRRPAVKLFGTDYPTPDGTCVRDYIHVSDLADAHLRAVEALAAGHPGGAFNLGNGEGFSVKQVVEAARSVTGQPIATEPGPRRPGDPARLVASSDLARREFGWAPKIPALDDILRSAWQWLQSHPKGYQGY